eukprot:m.317516 g.317516  ORF g.317516 m.317516 type:complete len:247 (-) comp16509_c1_seq2:24-764(-)
MKAIVATVVASVLLACGRVAFTDRLDATPPQKLIVLEDNESSCLDGTPYKFYIIPGSTESFSIFINGGGWCYNEALCLTRSKTDLGSSLHWNTTAPPGLFNCYGLENCTQVFMPYCDGSSFTSHRDDPWPVPNSSVKLHFRGKMNLEQTMKVLMRDYGLSNAKQVVLSGGSAGGLSTYLHLDRLSTLLPKAQVYGAPNAGYFLDHGRMPGVKPTLPFSYPEGIASVPPFFFTHSAMHDILMHYLSL